jgi:hypothetical protein
VTPVNANVLVAAPDCVEQRHQHVALQLLWEEYAERYGESA